MGKNIEAILRGYYRFHVNGKKFYLYNNALAHRKYLLSLNISVWFVGKHILKGERTFYLSWMNKGSVND